MKPMIFSYDHLYVGFNNRLQIWKAWRWFTWKDFFSISMLKSTGISRDVYDHWKRFNIRINLQHLYCIWVFCYSTHLSRKGSCAY